MTRCGAHGFACPYISRAEHDRNRCGCDFPQGHAGPHSFERLALVDWERTAFPPIHWRAVGGDQ